MDNKYTKEWKTKRIFKIENERFKPKKYIYNSFIKTNSSGFNSKNIYPYLFTDFFSKYYRMSGYNVMYPVGFNDVTESTFHYSKQKNTSFDELSIVFKHQLEDMGIGYDIEKEIILTDSNYISFVQNIFLHLYNSGQIYFKRKEIYADFSSMTYYNDYEVKSEGTKFYLIETNEEVYIRNEEVLVLNISEIQDKLMPFIELLDVDKEIRNEIMHFFKFKECLKINLMSLENNITLDINLDDPQYLAGISYIALNPKYIDVTKYSSVDEIDTVREYQEIGDKNFDCYTGIILKNPFNNEDIYLFASYKYDMAIHVGIPGVFDEDYLFANTVGLNIIEILDDEYIINSDFLNGLSINEARKEIVTAFTSEKMGSIYYKSDLNEIVISSNDEFGILVPLLVNDSNSIILDKEYYPVYYSNRYKIVISNEENLLHEGRISRIVFNRLFTIGLNNIYAKVFEYNVGNNDFFDADNSKDFNYSISVINNNFIEEVAMPIVFNLILDEYLHNVKIFDKIIYPRGLDIPEYIKEEYQRLNISFVDEVTNRYSSDAYRLYLLSADEIEDDLGKTLEYVSEYYDILTQIKNIYLAEFKIDVYEDINWYNFINDQNKLINDYKIKEYTQNIIKFFNGYIKPEGITIIQANKYLVMLSVICPKLCEEIYREIFINKYSIFYSEWPK